jgi:hypothetical protein
LLINVQHKCTWLHVSCCLKYKGCAVMKAYWIYNRCINNFNRYIISSLWCKNKKSNTRTW